MASECPTGRYASEIVTSSGLTLKKPLKLDTLGTAGGLLDWSGSEYDYAEWHSLLVTFLGRMEHSWRALKECPGTASMDTARYNAFVDRLNKARASYAAIRLPWHSEGSAHGSIAWTWGVSTPELAFDASAEVSKATGIIVDVQCLRQRLDEATLEMGCSPDLPGDTATDPDSLGLLGKILLAGGALALVGGTVLIAKKVMK